MKEIVLYAHGGSGNHGCEALVRTTAAFAQKNFGSDVTVFTNNTNEDIKYIGTDKITFIPRGHSLSTVQKVFARLYRYATDSLKLYDKVEMQAIFNCKNSLCFSIGGDNYCYSDYARLGRMNKYFVERGNKTILWGCSVEPSMLSDKALLEDLKQYSLITARESLTFEAMQKAGLENVMFCPDSAFLLPSQKTELHRIFSSPVVGINISPLVLKYEKDGGMTMKNYEKLIEYILEKTEMNIALIPHVIWNFSDDCEALTSLYQKYKDSSRIALVDDSAQLNACQLKYIISHCAYIVTARTHASIAAYSTNVPTLVTGYSVKAKGIAKDIFGSFEGFVCPVQNMKSEKDLLNSFLFITEHKDEMTEAMKKYNASVPSYFEKAAEKLKSI